MQANVMRPTATSLASTENLGADRGSSQAAREFEEFRGSSGVYHGAVRPDTRFTKAGEIAIAYQTFGEGPDLVICPGWVTNVEYGWELPEPWRVFAVS